MNAAAGEPLAIEQETQSYFAAHPTGPAALRHPRVIKQCGVWLALEPNGQMDILGVGPTVGAALAAFDREYLNHLRPVAGKPGGVANIPIGV